MNRATLGTVAVIASLVTAYAVTESIPLRAQPAASTTPTALARRDATRPMPEKSIVDQDAPYYEACARGGLNESECVGRLIWFKATAGNDRFHTYTFQQHVGVLVDWYRVLRTDQRDDRFHAWGIINDPSCCKP